MRHHVIAAVLSFVAAWSSSSPAESGPEREVVSRRVFFPNVVGYSFRATSAGSFGALSGLDGLVTYANGTESLSGTTSSTNHVEAFALAPALDVRLGRFTVGGAFLFGQTTTTYDGGSLHGSITGVRLGIEPRVGILVPIARGLAFWPMAKLGLTFGRTALDSGPGGFIETSSAIAMMGDLLFLAAVGSRFFVTFGPSAGWATTISTRSGGASVRSSTFRLGAGLGLGLAF